MDDRLHHRSLREAYDGKIGLLRGFGQRIIYGISQDLAPSRINGIDLSLKSSVFHALRDLIADFSGLDGTKDRDALGLKE